FFFSSRRRHTRFDCDWSSDVCSSDLTYAFSTVWNEMVHAAMDEAVEKRLEGLVEEINACLAEDESVVPGKEETLDRALAAYRDRSEERRVGKGWRTAAWARAEEKTRS